MSVMTTREPVVLAQASEALRRDGDLHRPSDSSRPSAGEQFREVLPLISAPAIFGPPVIVVLGPWLLLVFLLIGPVAVLITFVLVAAVAAGVLGVFVALIASPYLLLRHLRHVIQPAPEHLPVQELWAPKTGGPSSDPTALASLTLQADSQSHRTS